jgi:general secretion pathway protein K
MRRLNLRSQQGAAIIVALFVMALVAACAAAMMFRLNVDVERTELILNADKATLYAQGSVDWAIEQLKADYAKQKPNQLIDRLPISISNKTDGYTITSTLEDMQNKFNLNDLKDSNHQDFFNRLLHLLKPDMKNKRILTKRRTNPWSVSVNLD